MANQNEIETYINALKGPSRFSHLILWTSVAFFILFFLWAYFAKLDEVTHSDGKVIPSRQVQVIQNLEGGIVKDILVREGQIVEQDQVIMQLDTTQFSSEFKETRARILALRVKYEWLSALVHNKPFIPSQDLQKAVPQLVQSANLLYQSKQAEMTTLLTNKKLIQKEIDMTAPLVKSGSVSEVEVLRLEQQIGDITGKIQGAQSTSLDELNKTAAELDTLYETVRKYKDKVNRTTVRSPVKGIVKQLNINTVGGVLRSGEDILEIVPLDDTLLVEARVKPRDIGFLHTGQKAQVKISAYDFSIYGGLEGEVEHIGADTSIDEKSKDRDPYYEVWVRTKKNYLMKQNKKLNIIPGMTATVDILTGEKTVFDYIMKPILKARQTALTER